LHLGLETAEVWESVARRQKAEQLDWIGEQYRLAIGGYYYATPGQVKSYPTSLDELIEDRRAAGTRRHLRELYDDPFTGKPDWDVLRAPDGGIRGMRIEISAHGELLTKEFVFQP